MTPARTRRIGILGGTFDPIHFGHLAIAQAALEALGLERVVFVPSSIPPHRPDRPIASGPDRLAMVERAIAGNPAFAVSRVELDRPGPSYSVDTVERLVAQLAAPGVRVEAWFVLSSEAARELPAWHEPERLLDLACLAVLPRAGDPGLPDGWFEARFPGRAGRVRGIDGPRIGLSASDVRARAAAGRSVRYLVPDAVAAYIGDHGLYRRQARRKP